MKIIDLLCLISVGQAVPNKIKYDGLIFELNSLEGTYENNDSDLSEFMVFDFQSLNDEVEIIEADKKIQKIKNKRFTRNQKQIANKINEIIDKINKTR